MARDLRKVFKEIEERLIHETENGMLPIYDQERLKEYVEQIIAKRYVAKERQ